MEGVSAWMRCSRARSFSATDKGAGCEGGTIALGAGVVVESTNGAKAVVSAGGAATTGTVASNALISFVVVADDERGGMGAGVEASGLS